METRVFLGAKPENIQRDASGHLVNTLPPQLELELPIMFSAMSYGSISYNAHASLARAAEKMGTFYNTGEGGLHEDFYRYGDHTCTGRLRTLRRVPRLPRGGRGDRDQNGSGRKARNRRTSAGRQR